MNLSGVPNEGPSNQAEALLTPERLAWIVAEANALTDTDAANAAAPSPAPPAPVADQLGLPTLDAGSGPGRYVAGTSYQLVARSTG